MIEDRGAVLEDCVDEEQQLLERRLKQQLRESEEDSRWLAEEETNLVRILTCF